jgi:GT2 family glycosyltransferase
MTVYILLPVHNRVEITKEFVACLRLQTHTDYHLILLDDGSTDGTAEMVRGGIANLTVLRGKGKWWWGGALHQGYLWLLKQGVPADALILIMNDDTRFDPDFIASGVSCLAKHRRTLLMAECYDLSCETLLDRGAHAEWKTLSFGPAQSPQDVNCLATRGLFLRMADFREIGGFHPRLLPHYLSDYEFTIRAHKKKMLLRTDPSVKVRLNRESTGLQTVDAGNGAGLLESFFSLRSAYDLRSWTCFVLLACPFRYIPVNLFRLYANAGKCFYSMIGSLAPGAKDKTLP